ncbi:MAG: leucine-rich repeat domain-containing protein [Lachnospiraceae bacterium]|nr:leucine-rich repeat domain-containing protein [Lachnospiraceae bacterium]
MKKSLKKGISILTALALAFSPVVLEKAEKQVVAATIDDPVEIDLSDSWTEATLASDDSADWYKIVCPNTGVLTLSVMSYAYTQKYYLYSEEDLESSINAKTFYDASENNPETDKYSIITSPATYYVKVVDAAGKYKIKAGFKEYESEEGETTFDNPYSLSYDKEVKGVLTSSNSVDWYTFDVQESGTYTATFTAYGNMEMIISDEDNIQLNNGYASAYGSDEDPETVQIEQDLEVGKYYIKICDGIGAYKLKISSGESATPSPTSTAKPTYTFKPTYTTNPYSTKAPTTTQAPTTTTRPTIISTSATANAVKAVGESINDYTSQGFYVVTSSDSNNPTVSFRGPSNSILTRITIPKTITASNVTYTVTGIGDNAFGGCSNMMAVTINADIETIGSKAFYGCSSLTKMVIPASVKSIGKKAFFGCKKLKNIIIKTSKLTAKSVGNKAFGKTPKKAKVSVPKKKFKAYKKILVKKGINKKAKFKKLK